MTGNGDQDVNLLFPSSSDTESRKIGCKSLANKDISIHKFFFLFLACPSHMELLDCDLYLCIFLS